MFALRAAAGAAVAVALLGAPEVAVRPVWTEPGATVLGSPSADGRFLSAVDTATGDLALRDLAGGTLRRLTRNQPGSREFAYFSAISPGGDQVAYAWFNDQGFYDLRVVKTDGAAPRVLYRNPEAGFVQPCAWSPDGRQILTLLFRSDNTSQIVLAPAAGGPVQVLRSMSWIYPKKMDFSPDGRFIVYDSFGKDGAPERDIYVLAADGSRETVLAAHPAEDVFPVWSPDGRRVIFASSRSGSFGAWAVEVREGKAVGEPRLLRSDLGRFLTMGMTRQGLLFYGLRKGASEIYVAEAEGDPRPARLPSRVPGANTAPEWSPDGSSLAYLSARGAENFGEQARLLCIRSLATGQERELAPRLAHLERLRWSPDGGSLLVSGSDGKGRAGLFLVDVRDGATRPVFSDAEAPFRGLEGAWAGPDRVLYLRSGVRSRNLATREDSLLIGDGEARHLAVSRDGKKLAYASSSEVVIHRASGGEPLARAPGGGRRAGVAGRGPAGVAPAGSLASRP